MGMIILTCRCGQQVKAPGARPGRTGRCPACGGVLEVPPEPGIDQYEGTLDAEQSASLRPPDLAGDDEDLGARGGYFVEPVQGNGAGRPGKPRRSTSAPSPPRKRAGSRVARPENLPHAPMADGLLLPLGHLETGVLASMLYPLRGAETLAMVTVMGAAFWGFTILVPEYCLGVWADASAMGTPSMGMLVILISALPALLLLPLIVIYLLQYLGRVLVSSAMGDKAPPRTPDRNFDGLFSGLSPWLIWLVFGGLLGLSPLVLFGYLENRPTTDNPFLIVGYASLWLPYVLTSLMLSFLHDRPWAAAPPGVLGTLLRHGFSLLPVLLQVSAILGLGGVAFVLASMLRTGHFWVYLATSFGCWGLAIWISLVTMRVLGVHYHRNRDRLKWQHADPRWGVSWRL